MVTVRGTAVTVKLNVPLSVVGNVSVTDTVKLVDAVTPVGVPVISPVAVLRLSPVGNAGVIEYTSAGSPPVPSTGV